MDRETSREAFLRALHTENDREDKKEEQEEFVYRGKVKKDLEITGLEFIDTDELLEVTPESLRIRKKILDPTLRRSRISQ